jgi:hypothetical protein
MSYFARKPRRQALGDTAETIASASSDPYLSEVICRVGQLSAIRSDKPVPSCPKTRSGLPGGVGLGRAIPALRGYVWAEQRRWIYAVAAIGIVGLPMLVGYSLGRRSS